MAVNNPFAGPIKRTDLPIYQSEIDKYRLASVKVEEQKEEPLLIRQLMNESLNTCRHQFTDVYDKYRSDLGQLQDKIDIGVAHASSTLDFLRQEENAIPRVGAVAVGGLAGLIFGLRGGFFKKLIYTSTAMTGMAALCYPHEAILISKDVMVNSKKYASIGYNFINGVGADDKSGAASKPVVAKIEKPARPAPAVKGDVGMSNPDDKDLYTTRS